MYFSGQTVTTVGEEMEHNKRLTKPEDEFVKIMDNLNLPYPKQIGVVAFPSFHSMVLWKRKAPPWPFFQGESIVIKK